MKVQMTCPICQNETFIDLGKGRYDDTEEVWISLNKYVLPTRFVCTECGYLVLKFEQEDLEKIKNSKIFNK